MNAIAQSKLDRWLAILGIIFGVIGIIFAIRQDIEAKKQDTNIERIVLSVSTRYVQKFPYNLSDITALLARAKPGDSVLILVDFEGYGLYSAPKEYEAYINQLKRARLDNIDVRMLIYGPNTARESLQTQFKTTTIKNLSATNPQFQTQAHSERFQNFMRYHDVHPFPSNYRDFFNLLLSIQDQSCQQLSVEKVSIKTISAESTASERVATFFWLVDKKTDGEMIFAFPNLSETEKGFSFLTRDEKLIDSFRGMFGRYWEKGKTIDGNRCYSGPNLF